MNFTEKLKSLDGNDLDLTLGQAIANVLVNEKQDDPLRAYALANDIYKAENLDLNASDTTYITDSVKKSKIFTALVTGQILKMLQEQM